MNTAIRLLLAACVLGFSACTEPQAAPPASGPAPWVAVAKGRIDVEGGVISIAAPRPGIVREVMVEEGAEVAKGTLLARIDEREAALQLTIRATQREAARQALAQAGLRLAAARRELARLQGLSGDEVAAQERDQAADRVAELTAERAAQVAALAEAEAQWQAARFEVEQHGVRAPLAGRIIRRHARPGDGTSTLNVTPLFLFAPQGPRIVRAELEERYVDAVQPGQPADVVVEANERQIYPARVLRLGEVFGQRPPGDDPTEKVDVRVIECVLAVDAPRLRIGQRVRVNFARRSNGAAS